MPLRQALAATGGRCVLGYKDGMTAHGRLLPIVGGLRRKKARLQELLRMMHHLVQALPRQVFQEFSPQLETAAELRPGQRIEKALQRCWQAFAHQAHKK